MQQLVSATQSEMGTHVKHMKWTGHTHYTDTAHGMEWEHCTDIANRMEWEHCTDIAHGMEWEHCTDSTRNGMDTLHMEWTGTLHME